MKTHLLTLTLLLTSIIAYPQNPAGTFRINKEDLLKYDSTLSSPELGGRLPGSEGYNKAAQFAAGQFAEFGLKPGGDENYFQHFNIEYNRIDSPAVFKVLTGTDTMSYELGKDFVLRGFTGSNSFTLPVAFCGYGISRPNLNYDDYAGIDVNNKIVMVFKYNPGWKLDDKGWGEGYPREKSLTAKKHGAKGILFVSLPNDKEPQPLIGSMLHGEGEQLEDFPQLHISLDAADKLLSGSGETISGCQSLIDSSKEPHSLNLKTRAVVEVNAKYEKGARTMNVVGMIEGSDPELKNEYVVAGAHLDHVGTQAGLLFPGANDNASGSSGILEIAKAFTQNKIKPKRSVIFVLFAGEEQGLNGSKYFVESWKGDYGKIVAMLNLDCVGYGDSIKAGNGKSAPELWQKAKKIDEAGDKMMVDETWSGGGADATPFYDKGIPCLYFVTTNSYDHLHQPSDKVETLKGGLFEKIITLAYKTAVEISVGH